MSLRQWTVDAFASEPFRGNPACVVEPFDAWPSDRWMQALAQENNQAETAFLTRTGDSARFALRWFTPALEVPFCGHATLGAAHVLFTEFGAPAEEIVFETRQRGLFRVRREGGAYRLDFPADPPRRIPTPEGLEGALGVPVAECWAGQYLLTMVADEATVRGLEPDIAAIKPIGAEAGESGRGNLIVCAEADAASPYDVVSRFFAPGSGVAEDPTTGSAHTILGPLWSERLGRPRLRYHQAFPGRGGDLEVETVGDRAIVRGRAVTVAETRLRIVPA